MGKARRGEVLDLVADIYRAAAESGGWGQVLAETARLTGANGSTLEVIANASRQHTLFESYNLPDSSLDPYFAHYASICPRVHHGMRQPEGSVLYDYQCISEKEISQDESYDFFERQGLKYFLGGVAHKDADYSGVITVQRTAKQGHADDADVQVMELLLPHYRNALKLTMELQTARSTASALGDALDWMQEGVIVLNGDGTVCRANAAALEIARDQKGIGIENGRLTIAASGPREAIAQALTKICLLGGDELPAVQPDGIVVPVAGGDPCLVLTIRPYFGTGSNGNGGIGPVAILFIHDPLRKSAIAWPLLADIFGLTRAEANLALAIQDGMSPASYAKAHRLSMNTVYTHYRHLKDKMGCPHQRDLIAKLEEIRPAVRPLNANGDGNGSGM